ncbi:MAG: hypothetical protein IKS34_05110, partial [Clostridia bacterium]|nr:hypothetical protein [Clostridia bacterium]
MKEKKGKTKSVHPYNAKGLLFRKGQDPRMEDAAIVALFWNRDEDAIRQSQNKYSAMLLGISESLTGSRTDAEECV